MADSLDPWSQNPNPQSSTPSSSGSWTPVSSVGSDSQFTALLQAIQSVQAEVATVGSEMSKLRNDVQVEVSGLKDRMGIVEQQSLELYRDQQRYAEDIRSIRHQMTILETSRRAPQPSPDVAELRRELVDLRTRLDTSSNAVTVANGSGLPAHRPRMPDDSNYNGKSKDGAVVLIQRLESYAQQVYFANDRARILHAISFLTDAAALWAKPFVDPIDGADGAGSDWEMWKTLFLQQHADSDAEATASSRIRLITQGNSSLSEHISKFRSIRHQLAPDAKDSSMLFDILKDSLRPEVRQYLVGFPKGSVDLLINRLNEIDRDIDWARSKKSYTPYNSSNPTPPIATSTPAPRRDPNAMDVDALRQFRETQAKLRCTRCGGVGHKETSCATRRIARVELLQQDGLLGEGEEKTQRFV